MYFIIALMAYPAYLGLRGTGTPPAEGVQSLLFTGTRSISDRRASAGQPLVVMFRISGARDGAHYRVRVRDEQGITVYENDHFSEFNDREMATLFFSAERMEPGRFVLDVFAPGDDRPLHEYTFDVE
jgi:hypothetical protein